MSVFAKATRNFVRQIDGERRSDGSLIPVSHLNDARKLVPMAVVVKRNRFWYWQSPKYQPSDFTISDLLKGDATLNPDVAESDFVSFKGTYEGTFNGTFKARANAVNIELAGAGSSKLQSSFGKLRKQQVDVNMLLRVSKGRLVDMTHCLVQQLQKRNEVLAVLKEGVLTTAPCAITVTQKTRGSCLAGLGFGRTVEISVTDSNSEVGNDVSLEIPAATVIAYSLMELVIEKDGHFKLCLQPHTSGGFDEASLSSDSVDMCVPPLSALNSELRKLDVYLCQLAELPERGSLFQMLVESLEDRRMLTLQEQALEDLCCGEEMLESQPLIAKDSTDALLDLDLLCLLPALQSENGSPAECSTPPQLTAVHLLVSALEALPDVTLSLLAQCSPDILQAMDELMRQMRESCHPLPAHSVPAVLLEEDGEAWPLLEQLLQSCSVTLERATPGLRAETGSDAGDLPLVLCLTLRGLALLCNGDNEHVY